LTSAQYTADFNETRTLTNFTRANPAADETDYSFFWAAGTAHGYWDSAAVTLAEKRHLTLARQHGSSPQ
jgi:hypothetical protein